MLRLRGLCGSVPAGGHQAELKRPAATRKLAQDGKWWSFRALSLTRNNYEGRNIWDFWTDCFIVDRRKRLQASAAMICAGAVAEGSISGVTMKRTRSTSPVL